MKHILRGMCFNSCNESIVLHYTIVRVVFITQGCAMKIRRELLVYNKKTRFTLKVVNHKERDSVPANWLKKRILKIFHEWTDINNKLWCISILIHSFTFSSWQQLHFRWHYTGARQTNLLGIWTWRTPIMASACQQSESLPVSCRTLTMSAKATTIDECVSI